MGVKKLAIFAATLLLSGCAASAADPQLGFTKIDLQNPQASPTQSPVEPDQDFDYAIDARAEIEIDDQTGDGRSVMIEEIRVGREGTFLVIYDGSGLVLGTTEVSPQSQPVTVELAVELETSQELQATLYLDNGDGVFDLNSDRPLLDYEGELIHEDFYYRVD